jgi:endoplasmic reticulum Man9GlcNAc2 1,2-alpha-mannosidase
MPFQVPQNVPPFNKSTEREYEDIHFRNKPANGLSKAGISSKLNEFMGGHQDLPMYKDKPNPPSRRKPASSGQKAGALLALCALFLWVTGLLSIHSTPSPRPVDGPPLKPHTAESKQWKLRRDTVKEIFVTSWDGYQKYAWGMDEFHPISRKGRNMVEGGMGWIIVDSLDTAIMMNLTDQVTRAREWISTSLTYSANHDVSTFETTIRMLGGLLSAHYLSTNYPHLAPQRDDDFNQPGEDLYIEKATDLADRLLGAYDTTSGVPQASVNLNTSQGVAAGGDWGAASTAEAATLQLEMKYLSKLTGEPIYWQRAEWILKVIDDQHPEGGLVPIFIHPRSGRFSGSNIRLGSRGDSYYEYLIKQYLQTAGDEPIYLDMWDEALDGIKKHLLTYTKHASLTVLAERPSGLHNPLSPKMDHLACFLPGAIALAVTNGSTVAEAKVRLGNRWTARHDEDLHLAEELMKTCWGMYAVTPTGLAPEISYFRIDDPPLQWSSNLTSSVAEEFDSGAEAVWRADYDIHAQDVHNLQRPESVESLFYLYHITQKPIYRDWGWKMFESFRDHTRLVDDLSGQVYAYSSLDTVMENPVNDRKRRDNMESFWLAETLKYMYLLFTETHELDSLGAALEKTVINTEAHFLPRFEIANSKMLKTGWERTPRLKEDQTQPAREIVRFVDDAGSEQIEGENLNKHEETGEALGLR